jgi:hypothetical protein
MTLSITTLIIMTLSITTLIIMNFLVTRRINDSMDNETKH